MKYFLLGFLLFFNLGRISAQTFIGEINPFPSSNQIISHDDTLKILAIMVSFQVDQDGTTFGNGKFGTIYSQNYGNDILDPLPHDQSYFESHLQFVQNYYRKVSKGNLHLEFTVLPDTFSVSQRMREFSPSPGSDDFEPLGDFAIEAWTIADGMYPGFNFSDYELFIIFHAGVGRDVSLPGSIGNERDLPSVYLSDKAFKEIYGSDFEGIPVSGGSFKITNSMIMPETESREQETITGTVLFELTINGLLCASVGSHLGLPDLFDTETGLSAIGRFGLMDGQGIFAYAGTYPPEPSPWSKIRLGWADPFTMEIEGGDVSLITNFAAAMGDTVILKVPLNSSEYFLIENRARDAFDDGSTVTYKVGGNIVTQTFFSDTTGYQSFNVESLSGVILDVDEFDWALPGNGIVIWHIDENVIGEKIEENAINTEKNRRGVDVEEADGVQDIGETFITIFGDEVIGEGTDEDFWHASNPAELYENLFNKETRPNTRTNTSANSLITIKDFSEIGNRMNFKVEYGDSVIKPLFSYSLNTTGINSSLSALTNEINYTTFMGLIDTSLYILDEAGFVKTINDFSKFKTVGNVINSLNFVYGVVDSTLNIAAANSNVEGSINLGERITAPLIIIINDDNLPELLVATYEMGMPLPTGRLRFFNISDDPSNPSIEEVIETGLITEQIVAQSDFYAILGRVITMEMMDYWFFSDNLGNYEFVSEIPVYMTLTKDISGNYFSVVITNSLQFTNRKYVYGIRGSEVLFKFAITAYSDFEELALADLKQDGTNYIVVNNGNNVEVYNLTGSMADNFPFTDPEGIGFVGTPLTADFEGDNSSEIISITEDGRIFAIDGGTGKVVPGFPISVGGSVSVTPVLYKANGKTNLAVLNDDNVLSAWSISSVEGKIYWAEEFGNPQNTSFIDAAENTNRINEFFPENRAYNYPNPVYDGSTNIRYYVSEDSRINIKIFDLAGDYVAELNDDATGGMDNETVWNVTDIQSGVYFARIEATSNSGRTEQAVVKIAVVK